MVRSASLPSTRKTITRLAAISHTRAGHGQLCSSRSHSHRSAPRNLRASRAIRLRDTGLSHCQALLVLVSKLVRSVKSLPCTRLHRTSTGRIASILWDWEPTITRDRILRFGRTRAFSILLLCLIANSPYFHSLYSFSNRTFPSKITSNCQRFVYVPDPFVNCCWKLPSEFLGRYHFYVMGSQEGLPLNFDRGQS